MKKLFILMFLAVAATNINAQLNVISNGRVGIGTELPFSPLQVGNGNLSWDAGVNIQNTGFLYNLDVIRTKTDTITKAVKIETANNKHTNTGLIVTATGAGGWSPYACAVIGRASLANRAVGIFGSATTAASSRSAGIYGTSTYTTVPTISYPGRYAGYFKGNVRVTDSLYATVLSPSAFMLSPGSKHASDINTIDLTEETERVTDKLGKVKAFQLVRVQPRENSNLPSSSDLESIYSSFASANLDSMNRKDLDALESEIEKAGNPVSKPISIQYGLAADQLKKVYPELVYEDADGNVSINYVEMVPLLVQSINELSQELAELKGTSAKKAKAKTETTAIDETASEVDMVRMDQNKPNPFSESTVITLSIPEKTQKANIFIYDMSGKQVQAIPVNERGETNITVYASDLSAGMYIYTLVVDGKVAVTRKMIVSEV